MVYIRYVCFVPSLFQSITNSLPGACIFLANKPSKEKILLLHKGKQNNRFENK